MVKRLYITGFSLAFYAGICLGLAMDARGHGAAFWIMDSVYKDRYGMGCCGETDCRIAEPGEIVRVKGGWLHVPTDTEILDDERGIYPSIDAQMWRCVRGGELKCVFPAAGM